MKIKINFVDFWSGFNPNNNYFTRILDKKYELELSDNPDFLFYSVFGKEHLKYNAIKIFFTGENIVPDFNYCDYAIGFHHIIFEKRYLRYPLYLLSENSYNLAIKKHELIKPDDIIDKKFCNFIYSNNSAILRNEFFEKLKQYKDVDSGGNVSNNMGYNVKDKLNFQKNYKFSIAFENSYGSGYTTEKIIDAFAASTIPIYWGNPNIHLDFNPKSFINVHDYNDIDEVVQKVIEVDNHPEIYVNYINEPILKDTKPIDTDDLIQFFDQIINETKAITETKKFNSVWHFNHQVEVKITSYIRYSKILKPIRYLRNFKKGSRFK
jgi:hypothetical protein